MVTPLLPHMQKKNYERLQKALDSVMSIREMTQVRWHDPTSPMAPCEASPGAGSFTRCGILVPISILLRLGGHWGTHPYPLSPLLGVLPGDQEADGQAGPPGPSPPAMVRLRVLWPRPAAPRSVPTAPRPSPLRLIHRYTGWGGGQPGIPGTGSLVPHGPFLLGGGHNHPLASGRVLVQLPARPHSQGSVGPPCLTLLLLFLLPRIISSNRSHIVKLPLSRVRGSAALQVGCGMEGMECGMWDGGYGMQDIGYGRWDEGYGIWKVGCRIWDAG